MSFNFILRDNNIANYINPYCVNEENGNIDVFTLKRYYNRLPSKMQSVLKDAWEKTTNGEDLEQKIKDMPPEITIGVAELVLKDKQRQENLIQRVLFTRYEEDWVAYNLDFFVFIREKSEKLPTRFIDKLDYLLKRVIDETCGNLFLHQKEMLPGKSELAETADPDLWEQYFRFIYTEQHEMFRRILGYPIIPLIKKMVITDYNIIMVFPELLNLAADSLTLYYVDEEH